MLNYLLSKLGQSFSNKESLNKINQIYDNLEHTYADTEDPWGLNLIKSKMAMSFAYPIYHNYFKTRVIGKEKVNDRPYMFVANHSGQIPIDGMLITCAFLLDVWPPRILRTMIERFVTSLPFFSNFVNENGAVLGDRSNCYHLLRRGESILVFPEGVRGISKNTKDYYKVQNFTRGFFRLALKANIDILPISVVGAEEFFPYVYHFKDIAKNLKLPTLPVTPFMPFLGPVAALPLPSPVDIIIGEPYSIPNNLSPDAPDHKIDLHVKNIENTIRRLTHEGLSNRRAFWGTKLLSQDQLLKNALKT